MSKEYLVIAALVISSILLVTVFGRIKRSRENLFLILISQTLNWPGTILMVLAGKLENPVRLFPKATDGNFIMAFVFLPAVFIVYYWHYPRNNNSILQIVYSVVFTGVGALVHVTVEKYTDLMVYISISWYGIWLIIVVSYYVCRIYSDWYFSQLSKTRPGTL